MKENWKDAFSFNRRERRGITVLLIILLIQISFLTFWKYLFPPEPFRFTIEKLETEPIDSIIVEEKLTSSDSILYFSFDPNTVKKEELLNMGLKDWQSTQLINYRNSGGQFKIKSDVKKLYFVNDSIYELLKPFIHLPENYSKEVVTTSEDDLANAPKTVTENKDTPYRRDDWERKVKIPQRAKDTFSVALNISDTSDWKQFYGIGSGYSKRIIKYREKLGGYYSVNQLYEVYGLDSSLVNRIKPYLKEDRQFVVKININRVSEYKLSRHPYFTYNMAKIIVESREEDGNYKSLEDLLSRNLLNKPLYDKIYPYISLY